MSIEMKKKVLVLRDTVSVEEAEGLLSWLQQHPKVKVNLSGCVHLHAAALQVLMAAKNSIAAWPDNVDLRVWLEAALKNK